MCNYFLSVNVCSTCLISFYSVYLLLVCYAHDFLCIQVKNDTYIAVCVILVINENTEHGC